MEGSIRLSATQRKTLLKIYRGNGNARIARRANVLLLLADGFTWLEIKAVAYASNDLIAGVASRFENDGIDAAVGMTSDETVEEEDWVQWSVQTVTEKSPRDFGYFRSRWSCEVLAEVLAWEKDIRLDSETVRKQLREAGLVWRRPRPVVGLTDPEYDKKVRRIQRLLKNLPDEETAVFQDEVDVDLNPKIGNCWMLRGEQTTVSTPGNNQKRYLAGSIHWRTGKLLISDPATKRNTQLFVEHLNDLRRRLKSYRKIHVICDNAAFHKSRALHEYLTRCGDRVKIHFLPVYSPETNPIERVWWHMHEQITRNHQCESLDELLNQVFDWFDQVEYFPIESSLYWSAA